MREITLEELLEAGCHFGHQVTRHNPKSRDFVFEARDNIHIIDLAKTKEGLEQALQYVVALAARNGTLLVVGAKRQAKQIVEEEVKRAAENNAGDGLHTITNRWIGGILTNFSEVFKNVKKLKDLSALLQSEDERARYTKKELGIFDKERAKLESFYGGITEMKELPDALFIIDTHLEDSAVREARNIGATTVGIVDTNADPAVIDYPIPANDDAVGSLKLIIGLVMDAWIEGKAKKAKQDEQEAKNNKKVEKKQEAAKSEAVKEEAPKKKVKKEVKAVDTSKEKIKQTKKTVVKKKDIAESGAAGSVE